MVPIDFFSKTVQEEIIKEDNTNDINKVTDEGQD